MIVSRPAASPEFLTLAIDESGESWIASGRPVAGDDVMVTVTFVARGEPFEIEIPFSQIAAAFRRRTYSNLSESIGSSRDARRAG